MSYMFYDCWKLEEINFINFNTINVVNPLFIREKIVPFYSLIFC